MKSAGHPSTKNRQQNSAESLRSSGRGEGGPVNYPDFYHGGSNNNNNISNQLHPIQEITRGGTGEHSPEKKSHKLLSRGSKKVKSSKRQQHKEIVYSRAVNNNNQHSEDENNRILLTPTSINLQLDHHNLR